MVIDSLHTVRLLNLRKLIAQQGSVAVLSTRLKISPIYIYKVLEGKALMRDAIAKRIESILQLDPGALDQATELPMSTALPLLSLNQRITKSVKAIRYVEGKAVDVARVSMSPALREELITCVLDNFEQLAQQRQISLLADDKRSLLKLVIKRLESQDEEPE